ncbi:hypothetical protein B7494_g4722 [Chlorociboria aeruginascens]|nr:hypothetical protein B7494_g4722 [Chlorociboria aeruginascens]
MSKRSADVVEDGNQVYLKRQKITQVSLSNPSSTEEIRSARQLKQLLSFDQDLGRAKHGMQSLKIFLDAFAAAETDNASRISILKEYLSSQLPADKDDKGLPYLSDIMQTWSLAAQSNTEALLSAVPAALALLLKTISTILDFSEFGLRLGRTLLQKPQQELIARGLSANRTKDFVISPAMRLLRELTMFDGGSLAKLVFRARDQYFKSLPRNLLQKFTGDGFEDRRKPSIRTNSVRFVLAIIKFLPADRKRELLDQRDIVQALTRDMKDDPPFVVREMLETLQAHVLQDEELPRDAKTKIVNATSLGRIAMLYRYDQPDNEITSGKKSVDEIAHEFLQLACTSPDLGVLYRQTGFYPRGIQPDSSDEVDADGAFIDLGLDSIEWMNQFTEEVPVRNAILSDFIQTLRPWSNIKQSELLLSIFKSAPELVANYFYGKKGFGLEPKLTATWFGFSALIFSTIQLPIPKFFGHRERYARLPPPSSIVLESLLPRPLNQKVFTRCFNQPHKLISFFAIRLLSIAFSKLQTALVFYHEAAIESSSIWTQAATRLMDEFCLRCPSIKDVISYYRNIPREDLLQREAITKLLVLYYEVVPQIALDAKFDVSSTLAVALQAMEAANSPQEDRSLHAMELENLFQFARFSPGMRWFAKVEGLSVSPFTAMLKLSAHAPPGVPLVKLGSVLASVAQENQILQAQTEISSLDTLICGLRMANESTKAAAIYQFIDDCLSRCVARPIKYEFTLEELRTELQVSDEHQRPVSLVTLAVLEQWPFIVKSASDMVLQDIASFIAQHLAASIKIGEDKKVLKIISKRIAASTSANALSQQIIERSRKLVDTVKVPGPRTIPESKTKLTKKNETLSEQEKDRVYASMFVDSQTLEEHHNSLVKWTTKEVDEVIEGGHAAALVMLLSSKHLSVRKEAVTNLSKMAAKVRESNYEEKEQIWLLLSEVVETAKKIIDQEPLATVISSFASHAIAVLNDPLHCLYPKINKFLSQGPTWDLDKLPLMYKILDESPSLDDAHYTEISWLLNYMLIGLRTTADMSIYRKRRIFEKLFSLYNNGYLAAGLRDKVLKILFRATTIEGASTTLITRFSSMTWLQAQVALGGGVSLKLLMEKILESCDPRRTETWSNKGAKGTKDDVMRF